MATAAAAVTAATSTIFHNCKALAAGIIKKINRIPFCIRLDAFLYQDVKPVNHITYFTFFWLIQSQTQAGAASSKPVESYTEMFSRVLVQDFLQFLLC